MGAVYFYHLTETPLERVLPKLLEKAIAEGWRIEVRGTNEETLERLDRQLWEHPDDGFLPHGLAGGPHDAEQPILLTQGKSVANAPNCVMAVSGADLQPDEINSLARAMVLFDGANGPSLERARDQWRQLTAAGCAAQYWAQEQGKWIKKHQQGDT